MLGIFGEKNADRRSQDRIVYYIADLVVTRFLKSKIRSILEHAVISCIVTAEHSYVNSWKLHVQSSRVNIISKHIYNRKRACIVWDSKID
jgi:hypothetical protein